MKPIPVAVAGLGLLLSLTGCHHQSAAAKAQADYQAKEKALEQQMQKNSQNVDQRIQQLEQQSACGPWAPGMAAPKTPEDCAKQNAQWQRDQSTGWSLPSIPPKAPPKKIKH